MPEAATTQDLFRDDSYARSCTAKVVKINDLGGIVLDQTVFYPTGGGQPGDCGALVAAGGVRVPIATTVKDRETGEHVHVPAEGAPCLNPGDEITAELDWDRRHRLMRMHTALHLLCSLVDGGVTGGSIGEEKSRLDFDLPDGPPDKEELGAKLNALISADHPVTTDWITDEQLAANPDMVRTMSVKPPSGQGRVRIIEIPGVDMQPCGGTHVARTGEIGRVRIGKIEKKGRINRRISIHFD